MGVSASSARTCAEQEHPARRADADRGRARRPGGVADRGAFLERAAAVNSETAALYYADQRGDAGALPAAPAPLARLVPAQGSGPGPHQGRAARPPGARGLHSLDEPVAQAVGVAVQRAKEDFASARPEVWITGDASARASKELAARGWKIETRKPGPENALAKSGGK